MRALGRAADEDGACFLTGGATAVLLGWRDATIDVDIRLAPDSDVLLRAIQRLKDELQVNVELDFIPVVPGWEERSPFAAREGKLTYYHFELVAQALAKLERAHAQDLDDVRAMLERGLIDPGAALEYFERIERELYRFPAIDARGFRYRVEDALGADAS